MIKPSLQTSLGQHLVMTPQLRQAIHLLQLSTLELEAELASAVESNPLLDWAEAPVLDAGGDAAARDASTEDGEPDAGRDAYPDDWGTAPSEWQPATGGAGMGDEDDDPGERAAATDSLQQHLSWQLHLAHLSPRDRAIGAAVVDAIDDDGYLRATLAEVAASVEPPCGEDEVLAVLRTVQGFDPVGVGARDLRECLSLQLAALDAETDGRDCARRLVDMALEQLPKAGPATLARAIGCDENAVQRALRLLRTLDPHPGARIGGIGADAYVIPDCVVWRQQGTWRVALGDGPQSRLTIHRGYERMIRGASAADAAYLRGHLQEARWLLKNLKARGDTLLKVVRCLVRQQSAYLEFGPGALRPLTLRDVATEVGLHESTVSRAIARKHVRTPRGTLALRSFFASGVGTEAGGEASSVAIQQMIRRLVEAEDARKPLSDAALAALLQSGGVLVARRTVAKYREGLGIGSSQERTRR